jgi:hypothetical protein
MKKPALVFSFIAAMSCVGQYALADSSSDIQKQCEENGLNYQVAVQFVKNVQVALKNNDIAAFAKMGRYPVTINQGDDIHYTVKSVKDMMIRYPVIMTAMMQTNIEAQKPNDIICNDQGAATAKGEIWFNPQVKSAQFFVINTMQAGS